MTVRIGEPAGDRSLVPAGRRYLLRLRVDRPAAVAVDGHGDLPRREGPGPEGPGWWVDGEGFTLVRLPAPARATRDGADYDLKYQVSVWAMCGLSLTALFQSRSGMLPMLVLITRTP